MKQNKYDNPDFYNAYKNMARSVHGLEAAGEWHEFKSLLPELRHKHVLDLGCGFGWHCLYAREQQASTAVGVDISKRMLEKARKMTDDSAITYLHRPIEDIDFTPSQFDVVISSLALHYIESFDLVCRKISDCLKPGGTFVFSVEHPIFTSLEKQDWYSDEAGNRLHWPVDHYQAEGRRDTSFLTDNVVKYHRTLSTYLNAVINAGFTVKAVKEPGPPEEMIKKDPGLKDELRRPMFLIISAFKENLSKLKN